jgi:FkbM family methyltransferase
MSLASYLHHPGRILRKVRWQVMQARSEPTELTAETWNGLLTFNSGDRLISKYLYVRGAYERDYVTCVMEFLERVRLRDPRRDVVLDVGANIGMIAIALVKHDWFERAIAFEPEAYNFQLLTRNVKQNGYERVIACRQVALSSGSCNVELVINEGNLGGHFIPDASDAAATLAVCRSVRIRTVTCDQIIDREFSHLANRIGLVWMDIEGHEGHFLAGAETTLATGVPVVSEFYPLAIERSGMSRGGYRRRVEKHFTHVCVLENGQFIERPVSTVAGLFDEYAEGGTNVIYLRR